MNPTLTITRASVLVGHGTDKVYLYFEAPTAFPVMGYEISATVEAQHGFGATWVKTVLGIEPEVIES